jgi:hypothetical protein
MKRDEPSVLVTASIWLYQADVVRLSAARRNDFAKTRRALRGKSFGGKIDETASSRSSWPACVPAIHGSRTRNKDVDARNRSAHDDLLCFGESAARLDDRLDRIERRLELVGGTAAPTS